jgi:hypothetical protein
MEKMLIDPDSKLPVGSIVKNAKGEYGMIGYKFLLRLPREKAEKLLADLAGGKEPTPG